MYMGESVNALLDQEADVLYVRIPGVALRSSRTAPTDTFLILNTDQNNEVVGLQILYASDLLDNWEMHPDRSIIPELLKEAVDEWVSHSCR